MENFTNGGELKTYDTIYQVVSVTARNGKKQLIMHKTVNKSIYYSENKTVECKRNITKDGTVRIDGSTYGIMGIVGVKQALENIDEKLKQKSI